MQGNSRVYMNEGNAVNKSSNVAAQDLIRSERSVKLSARRRIMDYEGDTWVQKSSLNPRFLIICGEPRRKRVRRSPLLFRCLPRDQKPPRVISRLEVP